MRSRGDTSFSFLIKWVNGKLGWIGRKPNPTGICKMLGDDWRLLLFIFQVAFSRLRLPEKGWVYQPNLLADQQWDGLLRGYQYVRKIKN